jgi:hypothetical protein
MSQTRNADLPFDERVAWFSETYGDYFDAGWTLVHLVQGCGRFLARIVGSSKANTAMAEAITDLVDVRTSPQSWQEDLEEAGTNAFSEWPLGKELYELTAYAIFGFIFKKGGSQEERREFLESKVTALIDFYDAAPINLWRIEDGRRSELETLVTLVRNRWALDNSKPIEPFALAYFGDLKEGSIRNMMSGEKARFTNKDGKIPANEALKWLSTRPSFWNSVWQETTEFYFVSVNESAVDDPVFVPVARDGSIFHPGLRRSSGFTIGKKGDEHQEESFGYALFRLQQMPVPYWRRPNEKGHFGIVRGMRWVRLDRKFLESVADTPGFRLTDNMD